MKTVRKVTQRIESDPYKKLWVTRFFRGEVTLVTLVTLVLYKRVEREKGVYSRVLKNTGGLYRVLWVLTSLWVTWVTFEFVIYCVQLFAASLLTGERAANCIFTGDLQ